MSIKSTHLITREVAMQIVMSKIFSVSDSQLEDMLESFEESYFRNYRIVHEIEEADEYGSPLAIRSVNEF